MANDLNSTLKQAIRGLSLKRLRVQSRRDEIALVESPNSLVPAHWMAVALASGVHLRLTFKSYFMTADARILAKESFATKIDSTKAQDFLKEFNNLVVGSMKVYLEQSQIPVGASIPVGTRGFDEVFFPVPSESTGFVDKWRLEGAGAAIDCCAIFEIFKTFEITSSIDNDNSGEIEFF